MEASDDVRTGPSTRVEPLAIGLDVGSTTVKVVAMDPRTREVLHRDYQRHHTRQPEKVLELLELEAHLPRVAARRLARLHDGLGREPLCKP
jgi:activator of 2-hydroxyglutaryl-CoA dehydratase